MTGVLAALVGAGSGSAGGAVPHAMAWNNIFAGTQGSTQILTVAGIGGGVAPITASLSGSGTLFYTLNGAAVAYTGAFNVSDGDTLGWSILNVGTSTYSGTATIKSGSTTISTFTYTVRGANFY